MEVGLFLLGLLLRAPGLLFNGMADPDVWMFNWGPRVAERGLAAGFDGGYGYGIVSYAFAGISHAIANMVPRFWWAPLKFFELCFETGILWLLARLLGAERRRWAFYLFWLNPWFILHGCWHGYWDGWHTLAALLALCFLREIGGERKAWVAAGAALIAGAMFKPQGLIFFGAPVLLFVGIQFLRERRAALVWYVAGSSALLLGIGVYLVLGGGDAAALPRQYIFVSDYFVALCVNCVNVWRPVTRLLQSLLGQTGPTWALVLPHSLAVLLDRAALGSALLVILAFALRLPAIPGRAWAGEPGRFLRLCGAILLLISGLGWLRSSDPAQHANLIAGRYSSSYFFSLLVLLAGGIILTAAGPALFRVAQWVLHRLHLLVGGNQAPATSPDRYFPVLLLMIVSSLTIPQLGTRGHESHSYAALVLLILLVAIRRPLLPIWAAMCASHLLVILSHYRLGRAQLLPFHNLDAAPAQPLVSKIRPLVEFSPSDPLLALQERINALIAAVLPPEPISTIAASVQAVGFVLTLIHIYKLAAAQNLHVPSFRRPWSEAERAARGEGVNECKS